jgi:4-amino-4-deoxy-L-arabinose transferase-like glycosyltransferase
MSVEAPAAGMPDRATATATAVGRWLRRHWFDIAALALVLMVAAAVRLYKLGRVPRILQGDEANTIQDAVIINQGNGPGIIGFDWAQSPILPTYPLAWMMSIFGDSLADARLYSVIFSLFTVVVLYLLARESMSVVPAASAAILLATNVWFLNFSRTLWYNINAAFFAVLACWAVTRALKAEGRERWVWWAVTGLAVTGSLYGYSTGRFVFISITVIAIIAVLTRVAPFRRTLAGLVLAGVISGVLFAPMAKYIYDHYDAFTTRSDAVSVFEVRNPDGTKKNGWAIAWDNLEHNYRGLIFNDGFRAQRGPYNARYHPPFRAALEMVGGHLFLAGLVIGAIRWRRTYTWYPFFIPPALANIFSGDTPDYSRALPLAPFYFLFIGLVFEEVLAFRWRWRVLSRPVLSGAIVSVTAFIAVRDVQLYFRWQDETHTQLARMPGVDYCEYRSWLDLVEAPNFDPETFAALRPSLECSPIVAAQGGYDATLIRGELGQSPCADQPLRNVAYQHEPARLNASWRGSELQQPFIVSYHDLLRVYNADPSGGTGCVVYTVPDDSGIAPRVAQWARIAGLYGRKTLTDRTLNAHVETIVPQAGAPEGLNVEKISESWRTRLDLGDGTEGVVRGQDKDAIQAVDNPAFTRVQPEITTNEPVVLVSIGGETHIYPMNILVWHNVVNDTVGGTPIAVTFDPIAGAARVFDRRVADRTLALGVSGLLRNGNALLFDRETETWWQQLTGAGATGDLHEAQLAVVPSSLVMLDEALKAAPDAAMLASPGAPAVRYGVNPYLGYDNPAAKPIFTTAPVDPRLPAMQRVALITVDGRPFVVPFPTLAPPNEQLSVNRAFNVELGGRRVALLFDGRALSPLDASLQAGSRRMGALTTFLSDSTQGPVVFDEAPRDTPTFVDPATASTFDVLGSRIDGGGTTQLQPVDVTQGFWFSIASQHPGVEVVTVQEAP